MKHDDSRQTGSSTVPGDANLLDMLTARHTLCAELLDLSAQQRRLIAEDDYPQLLDILARKQRLLGRLDTVEPSYATVKEQWLLRRDSLDVGVRRDCELILKDLDEMFRRLLDEERSGINELTQRRDETQRQLQAISEGTRVHAAYRDSLAPATHRHLNIDL